MTREQRLVFGEVAGLYDRFRPTYPPALVDDLLSLGSAEGSLRAVEVGAGTGKATGLFAQRGVSVLALEPSPDMAAQARQQLARFPQVTVEEQDFERWNPGTERFRIVYAAQAWHWVLPEVRVPKAAAVLAPGGILAAFWNRPAWGRCPFRDELREVYDVACPELPARDPVHPARAPSPDMWRSWEREARGSDGVSDCQLRRYSHPARYTAEEYRGLLSTHSPILMLEPARRQRLLEGVAGTIDHHGGILELDYVTWLCLARAA